MAKEPIQAETNEPVEPNPEDFEQCWTCRFGKPSSKNRMTIICRRYPTTVEKIIHSWCGEYQRA